MVQKAEPPSGERGRDRPTLPQPKDPLQAKLDEIASTVKVKGYKPRSRPGKRGAFSRILSEPARIAQVIGVAESRHMSEVSLAKHVAEGLPTHSLDTFNAALEALQIRTEIVPEATLRRARKEKKPLPQKFSHEIYLLGRVITRLNRTYHGDEDSIREFLMRPHPLLQGEKPWDLARRGPAGTDAVLNLIQRAEAGVSV